MPARSPSQTFENQLADRKFLGSKPQGVWTEVVHLKNNPPFKAGVDGRSGHVDRQSEAGKSTAAFDAGRNLRPTRKLDPFMCDAEREFSGR